LTADAARRTGLPGHRVDRAYALAWQSRDWEALANCAEQYRKVGHELRGGCTLIEAALLAEPDSPAAARRLANAAEEVLGPFGADGDLARVRHLTTRRRRAGWRPGELSRTERAVAELLAEGLTNAEIAERLYVSRRTVESHVSSAYRKLGVTNRVALTRAVLGR
jgi:DNA-binding CsgD family transcriptional regulator